MTFRTVRVADRWDVAMPAGRAGCCDWGTWERCRFDSMAANLKRGDVLFDVGAEQGEISAAYAQIVGGDAMVMMEPHPGLWANIRATWEANRLAAPAGFYVGLVGAGDVDAESPDFDATPRDGWPECAHGDFWVWRSFRYIHEHSHSTPQTRLDSFAARARLRPRALTIDVEGYELAVLQGAEGLLDADRPLVWVSIHPDLMEKHCGTTPAELFEFMGRLGYSSRHLGTDHEEHWLFWDASRETPQ